MRSISFGRHLDKGPLSEREEDALRRAAFNKYYRQAFIDALSPDERREYVARHERNLRDSRRMLRDLAGAKHDEICEKLKEMAQDSEECLALAKPRRGFGFFWQWL